MTQTNHPTNLQTAPERTPYVAPKAEWLSLVRPLPLLAALSAEASVNDFEDGEDI